MKPGVWPASASRSISLASGLPRVWTSRICLRPLRSGRSTTIWRSKRPGRSSAGSRMSGRLVAAIRMMLSFISKPSISTSSWFSVCSRSSWPPPMPAPRWRPTASISSMKMMQGEFCFACSKRSRTRAGADADEHLDEVGAGDREERDAGLAGDGAREQRLTGAGRAVEQHALGDPGAERLELLRVLEELLDLVQLLHGLVGARDVAEGDLGRVHRHPLGARLAEAHHLRAAALHLVHQEDPEAEEEDEGQDVGEQREDARAARALDLGRDVLAAQRVDQRLLGVLGIAGRVLGAVGLLDVDRVVLGLDRDLLERLGVVLDLGDELVVARLLLRAGPG